MGRLYFRFYMALLGSLLLFALATMLLWHRAGGPVQRADATLAMLVQNALPPAGAPPAEQQAALERMAAGMDADMTLYDQHWKALATVGRGQARQRWKSRDGSRDGSSNDDNDIASGDNGGARGDGSNSANGGGPDGGRTGSHLGHAPPASYLKLADGRRLLSNQPLNFARARQLLPTALLLLALAIGVAAFPIVRHLTRRLERLQRGVESLGAGKLGTRVPVEGKDEVAQLARSFNSAADQIEQLVGAHKTLLANASHELRTPLARIRLALELIKDSVDTKRRAGLEQDIAELDHLLDEILLASRLDSVQEELATEQIDLLALAAEECARYDEVVLEGGHASLRGDARLLRRLLRNLLENAHRHGVAPTSVGVADDGNIVTLTVSDQGDGIPPAEWEKIFEPFYRRSGTRDNSGAGLGLALVRQIARRHGGEARCVALADGRSAFSITLPSTAPAQE